MAQHTDAVHGINPFLQGQRNCRFLPWIICLRRGGITRGKKIVSGIPPLFLSTTSMTGFWVPTYQQCTLLLLVLSGAHLGRYSSAHHNGCSCRQKQADVRCRLCNPSQVTAFRILFSGSLEHPELLVSISSSESVPFSLPRTLIFSPKRKTNS